MDANVNPNSVSATIQILNKTWNDYDNMKDDKDLGDSFHVSGRALNVVRRALSAAENVLKNGNTLSEESRNSLSACGEKAKACKSIFDVVTQEAATLRFESYKAVVKQVSKGMKVEILMVQLMEHVCDVAKDSVLKGSMGVHVRELRDTMKDMEPSILEPQLGNIFNSYQGSKQFNSIGGRQHNNTTGGNQFVTSSFTGPVHFGQNP